MALLLTVFSMTAMTTRQPANVSPPSDWRVRQQIRIRHLLLLQALDRQKSLSDAARVLSVTQPAATKMLAQLEDLLQVPLFERQSRGLRPTEYGTIMIRHAHAALGEISAAREALALTAQGALGRVTVGAVVGSLPRLTSVAIAQLLQQHPRLSVAVTVETSATLVPMLERGELDLVVGQVPTNAQADNLRFEPLLLEPIEIVASTSHLLRSTHGLTLAGLTDCLWVMPPPGTPVRVRIDAMFHAAGLESPRRVVETASTLLATALVQHSVGAVAILTRDVAHYYAAHQAIDVLSVTLPSDLGTIGIVTRDRVRISAATNLLIHALRTVADKDAHESQDTPLIGNKNL